MPARKKCPFCSSAMKRGGSPLPLVVNPAEVIRREHPLPLVREWLANRVDEHVRAMKKKIVSYRCPKCGFIAHFHKKR